MADDRVLPESGAPFAVRTTRRRGRMSEAKRNALIDLLPKWSLADPLTEPLTEDRLRGSFGRTAPRLLDVGVGTGEATIEWARSHPDHDVVAVELHRPGIARLLQTLEADGPHNVRIVETDVTRLLDSIAELPSDADRPRFDGIRVLFPDPWPKTRHLSRRLVDRSFVAAAAHLLPGGGWLHVATDWDGYALQTVHALLDEPRFVIDAEPQALSDVASARRDQTTVDDEPTEPLPALPWSSTRPPRPVTTYEQRGLRAGRRVTDLIAHRITD